MASFTEQLSRTFMTLEFAFDLQVTFEAKGQGTGYRLEMTSARVPKWCQTAASRSLVTSYNKDFWPDIWPSRPNSRSKDACQNGVKWYPDKMVTGYLPKATSARKPRWFQTKPSLGSHNHYLWPGIWPSRFISKSNDGVTDIVPTLR